MNQLSSWSVSTSLKTNLPPGFERGAYNLTITASVSDVLGSTAATNCGINGAPMVITASPPNAVGSTGRGNSRAGPYCTGEIDRELAHDLVKRERCILRTRYFFAHPQALRYCDSDAHPRKYAFHGNITEIFWSGFLWLDTCHSGANDYQGGK